MLSRITVSVVLALTLAGCPKKSSPSTGPVDNTTADEGAGACPVLYEAVESGEPAVPPEDCVRGEFLPILDAPAEAPSCLRVSTTSAISGVEQVVLADHGAVRIEHAGCAHWSLVIRFDAPAGAAPGAADVYRHAARVLRALPVPADDTHFAGLADVLDGAAAAATPVELGQAITVSDGFEYLGVSIEGGQIVVIDDVSL